MYTHSTSRGRRGGRTRHRFAVATTVLGLLVALASFGGLGFRPTAAEAANGKLTFTVGIGRSIDSLNPFNGINTESFEAWALIYDYMITYSDKDMSPKPGLATSWDTSKDGLTWTFHIRTGVKWSDGENLTAADIAYTYNRILDGGPEAATWGSYLDSVSTITAPDDKTVVLKLKEPNAVLPLLPMPIVPEHIWKDVTEKEMKSYPNEPPNVVGSGPFRLVDGKAGGSSFRFEANPNYWRGAPHMDVVDFEVFRSEDTLVQSLQAGEIDFADGVSPLQLKGMADQSDITTVLGDSPGFDEIAFNTGSVDTKTGDPIGDPNPAVLDPKFRFALNFAIDRDQLVTKAYQGAASPGTTIIPPAYLKYQWQPDDPDAFAYDPDKAKQLLDEAGYRVGSDGIRTMPDGSAIGTLRLFARTDSDFEISVNTMTSLKEWLDDLGIESKVVSVESNRLTNIILDGDFDLFQWGWYVEPDPNSMLSYFTCGQLGNWSDSWYCNKQYDKLYDEQRTATDQVQREDEVKQMQEMLYESAPYLVTAYNKIGEAYRSDRWQGFQPQPNPGGVLLFQYGVGNYLRITPVSDDAGGSGDGIDSAQIIAIGVGGVLLFAVGGMLGGWAGYRKASVDFRE